MYVEVDGKILKRADALAVGDRIEGTSTYDGSPIVWTIKDVREKTHPVLGKTIRIATVVMIGDFSDDYLEVFLKPSQKLWTIA